MIFIKNEKFDISLLSTEERRLWLYDKLKELEKTSNVKLGEVKTKSKKTHS